MATPSVADVLKTCAGCDVVLGHLPGGENFSILRGSEILSDIIANGQRELKIGHVPVSNLRDARRIADLLNSN
jgi:hypothetical protein